MAQAKPAVPAPKMGRTEVANRQKLGNERVDALKAKNAQFQAAKKSGNLKQFRADNPKLSGRERAQQMARARLASKKVQSNNPTPAKPTVDKVPPAAQSKPAPQAKPTANTVTKPAPQAPATTQGGQGGKAQDALNRRTTPQKPQDALNRNPGQKPVGTPASASRKIDGAALANTMRAQNSQSGNTSSSSSKTIGVDPSPGRSDTKSLVNNNKSQNVQNAKKVTNQMNQLNKREAEFEIPDYNDIPVKNSKGKTVKKVPGSNSMPTGGSNKSVNANLDSF